MTKKERELFMRVKELGGLSALLYYIAATGHQRFSVMQAAFFFLVAAAVARGQKTTLSELKEAFDLNKSIHNTYKLLMPPSRSYPDGLGWLDTEPNPDDERQKLFVLTDKGRAVIDTALDMFKPLEETDDT